MNHSSRLDFVPASPIRKLVPFATKAKKEGVKVYHFNIGDPDIKTPDVMLNVLTTWSRNPVGYSPSQGEPELLESVKTYYNSLGYSFVDVPNIQITVGGSEAISWAMFAVANPGDEILVFEPFYANYNTYAVVNGVTLKPVETSIENGFHLPDTLTIENYITKKTKAILICNPNNPTGTVYTKAEMDRLVEVAHEHNLFIISDEVYREFTYDNRNHVSLLTYMEKYPDRMIVVDSMSKRYSVCGARIGMMISLNTVIMQGVLRIGQGRLAAGIIDQLMLAKLTDVPDLYFKEVHKEYETRRNVLYEGLKQIPGVTVPKPEGAFYTIVSLPVSDAEHFCQWLLTDFRDNNETVMVAPATGFYATKGKGKSEVRIAYVLNTKDIRRCVVILDKALKKYIAESEGK